MRELGEDPEKRLEKLEELRNKLKSWQADPNDPDEVGLTLPTDKVEDDKFLLRFLRTKKFDTDRASILFVNYFKYRTKYSSMLGELSAAAAEPTLKSNLLAVLPHRTKDGCKVLVANIGSLDLDKFSIENLMKTLLVILDHLIEDEETQVHGFMFCEDLGELSFYKMMTLVRAEQIAKGLFLKLIQVNRALCLCGVGDHYNKT